MAASKSLRRLRDIRQIEEEQNRVAMQLAVTELHRLETARMENRERVRRARVLVASSAQTGEFLDRIAGLEEIRAADRTAKVLAARVDAAMKKVEKMRQEFLDKRIERRQVETVYEAMQARDTVERNRKSQQALDDWYRSRRNRDIREGNLSLPESDIPLIE
jgi:flagellar biosynthesis chaperone FliJ